MVIKTVLAIALLAIGATAAHAQGESEDIEPRNIGTAGTMMIGLAGSLDRFSSPELDLPTNYSAHVDLGRFITRRIVARGGVVGTGSVGGDDADEQPTGSGAPALHVFGGVLYYFSPQSILSFYTGGEYWAQVTQRADRDAGSIVARAGVEGAVSSRASIFIDGGYGVGLTRDDDGERLSRFLGRVGVRLKF
jgi:hypothetical protein